MILLDIQPYCNACCDFDPDVKRPEKLLFNGEYVTQTDTIVRCTYAKRCESIKRYLDVQAKKEAAE